MKTKRNLFSLIVGVMTLCLGLCAFFMWQFLTARPNRQETLRIEKSVSEVERTQPNVVTATTVQDAPQSGSSDDENSFQNDFDPDGSYYALGDLPKAFRDFQSLDITAFEYKTRNDGSLYAVPVPPDLFIYSKKKYIFTRVTIDDRRISFEAKSKNGLVFRFAGFFPEQYEDKILQNWVSLEGTLTKLKNGKQVAQAKVKYGYIHGCSQ